MGVLGCMNSQAAPPTAARAISFSSMAGSRVWARSYWPKGLIGCLGSPRGKQRPEPEHVRAEISSGWNTQGGSNSKHSLGGLTEVKRWLQSQSAAHASMLLRE